MIAQRLQLVWELCNLQPWNMGKMTEDWKKIRTEIMKTQLEYTADSANANWNDAIWNDINQKFGELL